MNCSPPTMTTGSFAPPQNKGAWNQSRPRPRQSSCAVRHAMRHQEERASPRHPVSVTALCQGDGASADVTVDNLSCHRWRLTTSKPVLVTEQHITIRIRDHHPGRAGSMGHRGVGGDRLRHSIVRSCIRSAPAPASGRGPGHVRRLIRATAGRIEQRQAWLAWSASLLIAKQMERDR